MKKVKEKENISVPTSPSATTLTIMKRRILLIILLIQTVLVSVTYGKKYNDNPKECFRAAVYEHHSIGLFETKQDDTLYYVRKNLEIFEYVAQKSKNLGADIIVFNENGLFRPPEMRTLTRLFMEDIPDVNTSDPINACSDDKFKKKSILKTLSCAAKNNKIYLVADMGDIKSCSHDNDTSNSCPSDGVFMYNTQVAFDPDGNLIAKYHKYHLFGEYYYDIPVEQQYVYFDTPFGRMGLFVCFDLLFEGPGIKLVHELNVTSMITSTWWMDEQPFLSAHQLQAAWSYRNGVNLLAANAKLAETGTTGSGIYSATRGPIIYEHSMGPSKPILLLANIPINAGSNSKCDPNPKSKIISFSKDQSKYHRKSKPISDYNHQYLDSKSDYVKLCHEGICCSLYYKTRSGFETSYVLAVTNSTHGALKKTKWCIENCLLIAYDNSTGNYLSDTKTSFSDVQLNATFSDGTFVYPHVMGENQELVQTDKWFVRYQHEETSHSLFFKSRNPMEGKITSLGFYGRCYQRDPPFVR